jgi:ubiquinone/menaquinone biosynthesis C-methylase UbiE
MVKVKFILDVGCGPLFIAHSLIGKFSVDYVGIDIIRGQKMKKYAKIIEFSTGKKINLVRASAECLPFREKIFDVSMSLDVLEHLKKPQAALNEMNRVTSGNLIISLPLENTFQKMVRFPILLSEGTLQDPTPQYHYVGSFRSYREIWEKLLRGHIIKSEYAPFGISETFNFEAIHLVRPFDIEEHNTKNIEAAF